MNTINLGRGVIIYYDIEGKKIGRKPTPSNLKEHGSDNSVYLGLVGNYSNDIICSIFNIDKIEDFSSKNYTMSFYGEKANISCNINNDGQIQIKVLGDGHMYRLLSKYKSNINKIDNSDNLLIFFDFNNNEIFFDELFGENHVYNSNKIRNEKDELEKIVKDAKESIKDTIVDVDCYIEMQINIRNSIVQKKFKDNLMIEFNGKCAICDIDKKELLRASHILPYSKCPSVNEMIDHNNGLLLCVNHDNLFDKGYISFDYNTGKIKIAKESVIDKKLYALLNINDQIILEKKYMTDKRVKYLATHKLKNK